MKEKRVVITGIGPVTSIGIGKEDFINNLWDSKPKIKQIPEDFETNYKFKSRYYIPFPEFKLVDYGFISRHENIMRPEDKIAFLATGLALEDAGFDIRKADNLYEAESLSNAGAIIGIGFPNMQTAFDSYFANIIKNDEKKPAALRNHKIRYNRMIVPMMMPNSVVAWVSIAFGLKGFSHTINASCASATYAIGEAYQKVKDSLTNVIITGGVECLHDRYGGIMRGFDMLGVLTDSKDGLSYPFSKNKNGFIFAEGGGCILILEELEHALRRNAHIYAEIVDFQSSSDSYNIVQMNPSGTQIREMLERLTGKVKIDYLNSHGTGTAANDNVEACVIRDVFGKKQDQPHINSTKAVLGHTIGASGAIEAAVTALSIDLCKIHGNTVDHPIDDINLAEKSIELNIDYAVSTSYGFGGHNAGLLFKRWQSDV